MPLCPSSGMVTGRCFHVALLFMHRSRNAMLQAVSMEVNVALFHWLKDLVATEAVVAFVIAQEILATSIAHDNHQSLSAPMADSSVLAPTITAAPTVSEIASLSTQL